ncbi:Tryptophan--tRNA ligase [bacterium HR34]|nr:Tryptophan--tRNA ligase [bacterium HR34]
MRVVSGIQPTGKLHIGNYIGAIKQFVELQKNNECFFFIANLHAITVPYDPKELKENTIDILASYIALGINPKKSTIFLQSQVKEHTELAWLLNAIVSVGELQRMTQFKDKSQKLRKEFTSAGLLNYPILMAADILGYKADVVPIGEDQKQHLELTRNIAEKFNKRFKKVFKIPEPLIKENGKRILSLVDPSKKMSKSLGDEHCLYIFENEKTMKEKIMKAVTDSGKEIIYNPEEKPGISNLIVIYSNFSNKIIKDVEKHFEGKTYEQLKKELYELLKEKLAQFKARKNSLLKNKQDLLKIMDDGRKKAQKVISKTVREVKKAMGII